MATTISVEGDDPKDVLDVMSAVGTAVTVAREQANAQRKQEQAAAKKAKLEEIRREEREKEMIQKAEVEYRGAAIRREEKAGDYTQEFHIPPKELDIPHNPNE